LKNSKYLVSTLKKSTIIDIKFITQKSKTIIIVRFQSYKWIKLSFKWMYSLPASMNWVLVHINQRFQSLHVTSIFVFIYHAFIQNSNWNLLVSYLVIDAFFDKRWKISSNWMCFLCLSHGPYHRFSMYSAIICYLLEVYNFLNIECKPFSPQNIMILFHFIS
jgi:hypothetical protein